MPDYTFKCKKCGKKSTFMFFLRDIALAKWKDVMQQCTKCKSDLLWEDCQIEFAGGINMNASTMGLSNKRYSNKAGGPRPIVDGKVRNDLKPKW